mmetsp:Transcript_28365/g.44103  ORF Transcript_28365/g.44103 Transcript_28365/m.44103 type:complete len:242 (+) Transcript_28365:240-965(+)
MKLYAVTAVLFSMLQGSSVSAFNNAPNGVQGRKTETGLAQSTTTSELPEMSIAVPFMKRPEVLTGELPGDVGLDYFGFANSRSALMGYREAEIKHARLAMLAVVGWPVSELLDLDASGHAPTILNGGLEKINPLFWGAFFLFATLIDLYGIYKEVTARNYAFPGDLGFDPLGLYPEDEEGQFNMQLAEIKHGRIAMIAVAVIGLQEYLGQEGVVEKTPIFEPVRALIMNTADNMDYTGEML